MTRREFLRWADFYQLFPFDDYSRYHRPAALISTSLGGGDIEERLRWLQPPAEEVSDADMNTLRAFGYRKKGG